MRGWDNDDAPAARARPRKEHKLPCAELSSRSRSSSCRRSGDILREEQHRGSASRCHEFRSAHCITRLLALDRVPTPVNGAGLAEKEWVFCLISNFFQGAVLMSQPPWSAVAVAVVAGRRAGAVGLVARGPSGAGAENVVILAARPDLLLVPQVEVSHTAV